MDLDVHSEKQVLMTLFEKRNIIHHHMGIVILTSSLSENERKWGEKTSRELVFALQCVGRRASFYYA